MLLVRKVLLLVAGVGLTLLGIIGLLLPVLPGVLFLIGAVACFSLASRRLRVRLERHPRYRRAMHRWRLGSELPIWHRLRLAFWLTLSNLLPDRRR